MGLVPSHVIVYFSIVFGGILVLIIVEGFRKEKQRLQDLRREADNKKEEFSSPANPKIPLR